ncbi:hypothetical protein NNG64_13500 [Bacillus siamensis]|uniref:Uncharacterized protein n=1 Tax=Bacillus siamensis TaxID=659243 RepID=A0AAI8HM52_9BACI|nr:MULTISPECIES: hypothetical protein [Bacillus]AME07915.1 hypothetical protein AUL54_17110 [Bacillus sp. SDLI1]AUJ76524.1 hypothetical protein CWD84_06775 [Bacillus siamensis]UUA83121.1 hypothetical protein NNG64_13500 [Bacillus siamensis]
MRDNKECCPYCNADLKREPIPKESQKVYGSAHFIRKIGINSIEGDRIIKWKCPDCNKEWDRD